MSRITTFLTFCLLTAAFPVSLFAGESSDRQPNIVFFFTDDQTSSTLGCYGNPIAQTPKRAAGLIVGSLVEKIFQLI